MWTRIFSLLAVGTCSSLCSLQSKQTTKVHPSTRIETTVDMRKSAMKEFNEADAQLNKIYGKLLSRLGDEGQKAKLRAAEKAWLKYRNAHSEFEAAFYEGGSIQPQMRTGCLTTMTKNRIKELQNVLDTEFDH